MNYVKIITETQIEYAPEVKTTEAGTIVGYNRESNETMLLADGYLKYTKENAPVPPSGGNGYYTHTYTQNGNACTDVYTWVEIPLPPPPEPLPPIYSKLKIMEQLLACETVVQGVSARDAFYGILTQAGLKDVWDNMIFLSADDPRVIGITTSSEVQAIMTAYGLDITTVLTNAEDETLRVLWTPYNQTSNE